MDCLLPHLHVLVYYLQKHTSTGIVLIVLPPELDVEGLRVVAFPVGGTVCGGRELEVELVVGEEGGGPAVSVVFAVVAVEDAGV